MTFKLATTITGQIKADMEKELRKIEKAVPMGVRMAGKKLKDDLRRDVLSAGLGNRLARTWRDRAYPNNGHNAAALVWTKAPELIQAFDKGVVIRGKEGFWLAIPTVNAPKRGIGGKRINPSNFPEHRFGKLRFVYRGNQPSLLVVDNVRASYSRKTGELRGFRKATASALKKGRNLSTVVMFVLVPKVRIPKKLDVKRTAERWIARLPQLIESNIE